MKNESVLKLNQKPHTPFGIASFFMAIIGFILIGSSIFFAASRDMDIYTQKVLVGVLEWIGMMITLSGIGVGIIAEGAKEREKIFAHIGLLLHFVALIYHGFVIYFGYVVL